MRKPLEFYSRTIANRKTGETALVAVPQELPEHNEFIEDRLLVDGEDTEISPQVVRAVTKALTRVRELVVAQAPIRIDCMVFGTLLCDGQVYCGAYNERAFPYRQTSFYRDVTGTGEARGKTRVLEPTVLGKIVENGGNRILGPNHMAVALDERADLFIQKFGDSYIGITGLDVSAKMYDSDTIGTVLFSRTRNAHHRTLLQYEASDAATAQYATVATAVNIGSPSDAFSQY